MFKLQGIPSTGAAFRQDEWVLSRRPTSIQPCYDAELLLVAVEDIFCHGRIQGKYSVCLVMSFLVRLVFKTTGELTNRYLQESVSVQNSVLFTALAFENHWQLCASYRVIDAHTHQSLLKVEGDDINHSQLESLLRIWFQWCSQRGDISEDLSGRQRRANFSWDEISALRRTRAFTRTHPLVVVPWNWEERDSKYPIADIDGIRQKVWKLNQVKERRSPRELDANSRSVCKFFIEISSSFGLLLSSKAPSVRVGT